MTDHTRALLEQALEALEVCYSTEYDGAKIYAAKLALRAALAAPATAPDELERLRKDAERMKEGLDAVEVLIDNSSGVAGLHLNGDLALWSDLRTGGHFEAWLLAFDEAIDAAMKGTP
jgi:hypothetical protein